MSEHWRAARTIDVAIGAERAQWQVPEEAPVALVYNDLTFVVMLATPADLEDFALGLSLSEGIAGDLSDVAAIAVHAREQGIDLRVTLTDAAYKRLTLRQQRRNLTGRSGCGVCGIDSAESLFAPLLPVADMPATLDADSVARAALAFQSAQPLRQATRSVHGAAWCTADGAISLVREDVGRHNALDKMLGALARTGQTPSGFALISSRCSYEMVEKAARRGVRALVSLSAPTAFAVRRAHEARLTLGVWSGDQLAVIV